MEKEKSKSEMPKSLFGKMKLEGPAEEKKVENEHLKEPHAKLEHEMEPSEKIEGAVEHPEEDATGTPIHPKLQTLLAMLKPEDEDEKPSNKGGFLGLKK